MWRSPVKIIEKVSVGEKKNRNLRFDLCSSSLRRPRPSSPVPSVMGEQRKWRQEEGGQRGWCLLSLIRCWMRDRHQLS